MMWLVTIMGIGMAAGGLVLHRELEGEWIPSVINPLTIRYWHNKMATPFALVLMIMIGTGLLMWGIPKILSKRAERS